VAKEVEASEGILIDVFERIETFFRRLEVHTKVPPTPAMKDMMIKITAEVLDILGTATKEMKQSRASEFGLLLTSPLAHVVIEKFLKKVAGITKLDDGLKRLDKMANEESKMAIAEALRIAQNIETKVDGVDEKLGVVGEQVEVVGERVEVVGEQVEVVVERVEGIGKDVKVVEEMVQTAIEGAQIVTTSLNDTTHV